ncbi:hypothetical protein ABDJ41_01595 [Pedobacter sp. ASV1-7]|uniref:hypothetical protein n=1 Tax=Pedobacter sp. ASV1-7 TaxID=3145237 RepID=UPI0032E859AB
MNKDWLDIDVLEDYLDGKLDAKTMNRVEREALEDPFVAEALAGLSASPKRSLQSISLLQKQLHERVAEHKNFKKTSVITWQRLSIAAAAAVMFVAVSVMFWMKENNYQKELAGRAKKVDVTIAPVTPEVVPPAVQSAPVIASESADEIREKEIEKAVKVAKTNSYAARVKPRASLPPAAADQLNETVVSVDPVKRKAFVESLSVAAAPLQTRSIDSLTLNEVVVVGYGAQKKVSITDSSRVNAALSGRVAGVMIRGSASKVNKGPLISNPIGGWDKLWTYIDKNNAFKNEELSGQFVQLEFKIGKDGSPEDIKILKSADQKYVQEAIRLLLNGPKWEQPTKENSKMTFKIDF